MYLGLALMMCIFGVFPIKITKTIEFKGLVDVLRFISTQQNKTHMQITKTNVHTHKVPTYHKYPQTETKKKGEKKNKK